MLIANLFIFILTQHCFFRSSCVKVRKSYPKWERSYVIQDKKVWIEYKSISFPFNHIKYIQLWAPLLYRTQGNSWKVGQSSVNPVNHQLCDISYRTIRLILFVFYKLVFITHIACKLRELTNHEPSVTKSM